jgi:hypothetical protein
MSDIIPVLSFLVVGIHDRPESPVSFFMVIGYQMLSVSSSFWLVLAFLLRILYFLCSPVLYLSSTPFQVGQCMSLLWILIVRYNDSMSSSPMVIGYGLTWFH